ncbi:MAG: WD40 repeat domain-containing protein, partial [Actinocrinis sp.]
VLDDLERERLVSADQDTVHIAHEALLRHWPTLRRWLDEHRSWLRVLQRLTERAREWDEGERHRDLLLHGAELTAVHAELGEDRGTVLGRLRGAVLGGRRGAEPGQDGGGTREEDHSGELGALETAFLRASERGESRKGLIRRATVVTVTVALIAAGVSAAIAVNNDEAATRQRAVSLARQLGAESNARRATDPQVALLLALEAYRVSPTTGEAVDSLLSSQAGYFTARLANPDGAVNAVAYDPAPGSGLLAAAGQGGAVTLWDTGTLKQVGTLTGPAPFYAAAFDPSGRLLAAAGQNGATLLWDTATRKPVGTLSQGPDAIDSVAFSPDGRTLATAGYDGTVRLWDVAAHRLDTTITVGHGPVGAVAFSPDGGRLAVACTDGEIRVWTTAAPHATPLQLRGHTGLVRAVAFSPDGSLLASGGDDATVRLWDAHSGAGRGVLNGSAGPVRAVAFNHHGTQLASAGEDDAVRVWDPATLTQVAALTGPANAVAGVAFSPDDRTLAGADTDATVGLWNVAGAPRAGGGAAT